MLMDSSDDFQIHDVSVVDPQTQGEGRQMTTTYRIDVVSSMKNHSSKYIRRRYSDFQWLYQRLMTERPGTILPSIPHKRALTQEARFSEELIGERRIQLQNFLQQVTTNPEIVSAPIPPSLMVFLTYESAEGFEEAKKELEKTNPDTTKDTDANMESLSLTGTGNGGVDSRGGKIRNMFARGVTAMNMFGGTVEPERTEDEDDIDQLAQYCEGMDLAIKLLLQDAAALTKSTSDSSAALEKFGESAFGWLVAHRERFCPNTTNSTVETFRKISEFFKYASSMEAKRADQEVLKLEQSIADLQRKIGAVGMALRKRREHTLTLTTRVQQTEARKTALAKLRVNGKVEKIRQAEADVAAAQQQAEKARQELEVVTKRVLREMDRVQAGLDAQLRRAVADYARIQLEHSKQVTDAWTKFLPHVDGGEETPSRAPPPVAAPPVPPNSETESNGAGVETPPSTEMPEDPFANVPVPTLEADKDMEVVGI